MTAQNTAFSAQVAAIEGTPGYARPKAWAIGVAHLAIGDAQDPHGRRILDTWYPVANLDENFGACAVLSQAAGLMGCGSAHLTADALENARRAFDGFRGDGKRHANIEALDAIAEGLKKPKIVGGVEMPRVAVLVKTADLAQKPADTHDAYLRLSLLSQRKVKPNGQNLDGLFGQLNIVVWTDIGPFDPEGFEAVRLRLFAAGVEPKIHSVDKFPRMVDYVVPTGVRIADADRVRLGAHLADGTTLMHEGFCNFNAGTTGKSMVEGRISQGVVVGAGSDIGGGASIMGTLSGGGKERVAIGENSLLGANAGLGIALGNNCLVESGLYVTAGSKVKMPDGSVVKAATLSGKNDLLFRRNSQTGAIEVVFKKNEVALNAALHAPAPKAPKAP